MRLAAEQIQPVAPETMRAVLGHVPTGVMVVTVAAPGGQAARTANSFTSVSLEPPLVSVCFGATSPFATALCAAGGWGVSVLADDQRALSTHFARRETGRGLTGVPHTLGRHTGAALLTEAVVTMECRSVLTHPAGDHVLIVAEVLAMQLRRDQPPLVFHRGDYHSIGPRLTWD
jgi:flavin reductase (DIM6/NTAB) family NADH-FMN oxidoreductase RutF